MLATVAFLLSYGAGCHALWLVESTIQDLRQELQQTHMKLGFQRVWNANLEDVYTVLEAELREHEMRE